MPNWHIQLNCPNSVLYYRVSNNLSYWALKEKTTIKADCNFRVIRTENKSGLLEKLNPYIQESGGEVDKGLSKKDTPVYLKHGRA